MVFIQTPWRCHGTSRHSTNCKIIDWSSLPSSLHHHHNIIFCLFNNDKLPHQQNIGNLGSIIATGSTVSETKMSPFWRSLSLAEQRIAILTTASDERSVMKTFPFRLCYDIGTSNMHLTKQINTPGHKQNGRRFADGIFVYFRKWSFKTSDEQTDGVRFWGLIDNKSILVQLIAWFIKL